MTDAARKLLQQAMGLSAEERLMIAGELVDSVRSEPDPDWEEAWIEELDRRLAQIRSGAVETLSWTEVREKLRAPST